MQTTGGTAVTDISDATLYTNRVTFEPSGNAFEYASFKGIGGETYTNASFMRYDFTNANDTDFYENLSMSFLFKINHDTLLKMQKQIMVHTCLVGVILPMRVRTD